MHDFETPRWVQKSRMVEIPEAESDEEEDEPSVLREERRRAKGKWRQTETVYEEPRRAVTVAVNAKFSLLAVGMHRCVDFSSLVFSEFHFD